MFFLCIHTLTMECFGHRPAVVEQLATIANSENVRETWGNDSVVYCCDDKDSQ